MQDHALKGKILGILPSEGALVWWINTWWNTKGHFNLQFISKGFFTIIFHNIEGKENVFNNGAYFFNSVELYLHYWIEKFIPQKEYLMFSPVWVCLYSLPYEYYNQDTLEGIMNTLGKFVNV